MKGQFWWHSQRVQNSTWNSMGLFERQVANKFYLNNHSPLQTIVRNLNFVLQPTHHVWNGTDLTLLRLCWSNQPNKQINECVTTTNCPVDYYHLNKPKSRASNNHTFSFDLKIQQTLDLMLRTRVELLLGENQEPCNHDFLSCKWFSMKCDVIASFCRFTYATDEFTGPQKKIYFVFRIINIRDAAKFSQFFRNSWPLFKYAVYVIFSYYYPWKINFRPIFKNMLIDKWKTFSYYQSFVKKRTYFPNVNILPVTTETYDNCVFMCELVAFFSHRKHFFEVVVCLFFKK